MTSTGKYAWALFMAIFIHSGLFAQEATILVETSPDTIYAGMPFQLRVKVEDHQGRIVPPDLTSLKLIGGPSQSSSFSMVNGTVKRSASITYTLVAEKEGTYDLGKAVSEGRDDILETGNIVLEVLPGKQGAGQDGNSWKKLGETEKEEKSPERPKLKTRKY